jgi:hypothetical protein
MSPRARYLSTTVALTTLAAFYVLWQGQIERPTPRRPAASAPVIRPTVPREVSHPLAAREILDQARALELSDRQISQLHALDGLWGSEVTRLEAAIRQAEGEVAAFMEGARMSGGASIQEIQQRSAGLRGLGALLRERRQRHSDAAVGLLTEGQRQRLAKARFPADETGRH